MNGQVVNQSALFINNNGNVSVGTAVAAYEPAFGATWVVAPLWCDVDTTSAPPPNTGTGAAWYKFLDTDADGVSDRFVVTWDAVPTYPAAFSRRNTFQVVIATDVNAFGPRLNAAFSYGELQWCINAVARSSAVGLCAANKVSTLGIFDKFGTDPSPLHGGIDAIDGARFYVNLDRVDAFCVDVATRTEVLCPGSGFSLSATVIGGRPSARSFQWQRDGAAIASSSNPSAITSQLTVTAMSAADSGRYDCLVTDPYSHAESETSLELIGPALGESTSGAPDGIVRALLPALPDLVMVGGDFSEFIGLPSPGLGVYNPMTDSWERPGERATDGSVLAIASLPNGDIVIGGQFTRAGGPQALNIARYSPDSRTWSALGGGVNGTVRALAVLTNGDLVIGGTFTSVGSGIAASNLARFRSSNGSWIVPTWQPNSSVLALRPTADGGVVVGGSFDTFRISPFTTISTGCLAFCPLNPFTAPTLTSPLLFGTVNALSDVVANSIFVGGSYRVGLSTGPQAFLGRYDPSTATHTPSAFALDGGVRAFATDSFGGTPLLYIGGDFTTVGGLPASHLARLDPGAFQAHPIGSGASGPVYAIAAPSPGLLLVGGEFTQLNGVDATNIGRLVDSADISIMQQPASMGTCAGLPATFEVIVGLPNCSYRWSRNGVPISLTANPTAAESRLVISDVRPEDAATYTCRVGAGCVFIDSDPAELTFCVADFNCDGGVDGADIDAFFALWESGQSLADVNADGGVDGEDVTTFFGHWEAGC